MTNYPSRIFSRTRFFFTVGHKLRFQFYTVQIILCFKLFFPWEKISTLNTKSALTCIKRFFRACSRKVIARLIRNEVYDGNYMIIIRKFFPVKWLRKAVGRTNFPSKATKQQIWNFLTKVTKPARPYFTDILRWFNFLFVPMSL